MSRFNFKSSDEVEKIRKSCLLVCKTLAHVAALLRPGMTGKVLDAEAEALIRDHGAEPGFKGYHGFPSTLCISLNEEVVHGIPSDSEIQPGDIVSVDCGVYMDEYYGDAAYTFAVGEVDEEVLELMSVTNECLYRGIDQAISGNRVGDIGHAIQSYAEGEFGYGVVRELVGHGLGRQLHEPPEVPNYGKRGRGPLLKDGLVIAIEPMINLGTKAVTQSSDGWTIRARDRKPSAHFEHSVVVRSGQAEILSDHLVIEEAIKNNPEIKEISKKR